MTGSHRLDLGASANLRGVAFYSTGIFLGSLTDVLIKWLSAGYPILEIMFFRALFGLIPAIALIRWEGGIGCLRSARPDLQIIRGLIAVAGFALFYYAFSIMPLANAYAVAFAAPLVMTALSRPLLGEAVGLRRWGAVLVGFGGILIVLWPDLRSGGLDGTGWLAALAGTILYAIASLMIRRLSRTDGNAVIVLYGTSAMVAVSAAALPFGFVVPAAADWPLLIATGLLGGLTTIAITAAFRAAEAASVAPFEYTSMLWAVLFGYVIWGDIPTAYVLGGSAVIVAATLYVLHRERRG